MLSDRCLSVCPVLSVTLVYCGQTVGWIKTKLGMQVVFGPGHTVLDGEPAPHPQGGRAPIFYPYLLWANGWMDQHGTWHRDVPWSRLHCARLGPSSSPPKGNGAPLPIFGPFLLWPNGWMNQDANRYGGRPQPRRVYVRWGPSPPSLKTGRSPIPNFKG